MNTTVTLNIPNGSMPESDCEREQFLLAYFRDLLPTATRCGSFWQIVLERPHTNEFYIDPALDIGMEWWGETDAARLYAAVEQRKHFLLCLHDCWTLFSWAQWLAQQRLKDGPLPQHVNVLHLDDHNDLMDPLIVESGSGFDDLITGKMVQLTDVQSVAESILSGAIGVGSFVAPFVHFLNEVTFLHLVPEHERTRAAFSQPLIATYSKDELLKPQKRRPACILGDETPNSECGRVAGVYHQDSDLESLLMKVKSGPILLHIDMDYFNNRFDGDSDWKEYKSRHDPTSEDVLRRIEQVFSRLCADEVASRIEDIAIGISPGFFPAEMWRESIDSIEQTLSLAASRFAIQDRRIADG